MGNIELKQAFQNATEVGDDLSTLQQDVLTEEKIIDQMYNNVVIKMIGDGNKLTLDKAFPDSNIQINESREDVFRSETIQQISDNLLSGFTPALGLLQNFNQQSDDELFTAISPVMVEDYTNLQKKKFAILYALFIEKQRLGQEKKTNFFEYISTFLSQGVDKNDTSGQRLVAGLQGGLKFVINLLREIRDLTKLKDNGFPERMLVNSLEYLFQAIKEIPEGSLYNTDHVSFMLDQNINEARTFLVSIVNDKSSSSRAMELAAKIIFQISLSRTNVEDLLVTASLLDRDNLFIDLRSDFEVLKLKDESKKDSSSQQLVQVKLKAEELAKRTLIKEASIESLDKYSLTQFSDESTYTTDGEHIYMHQESRGLFKISIEESNFGKVILHKNIFTPKQVAIAYLNGKLYVKNQVKRTKNSSKQTVDFIVLDSNTFEEIRDPGQEQHQILPLAVPKRIKQSSEFPSSKSDSESSYYDLEEEEESHTDSEGEPGVGEEIGHSLKFTKPTLDTKGRVVLATPLVSDGQYIYIISFRLIEKDITVEGKYFKSQFLMRR